MTSSTLRTLVAGLTLAALYGGCGKKGNPLPPLRPVPARIADLAATRAAGRVTLKFTVPAVNLDGTTPVLVDRIDIYAASAVEGQAPPSAAQLAGNQQNLIESLPVRRPSPADPSTATAAVSALVPQPGETAVYFEETAAVEARAVTARYYVAVPVAGTGRGRPGPPTPVATVPLGALPGVPADVAASHDEANVRLAWTAGDGLSYRVLRAGAPGTPTTPLSTTPVATPEFVLPVEFGREVCLQVQSLRVAGPVTLEGVPSSPVCVTPEDRYAPAAPASLQVVQEGAAVTIIWSAVDAADLAGYVVWRADGADGVLAPLPGGPAKDTTYRDASVVVGTTYVYAVRAIDTSAAANTSALSPRETITVR